MSSGNVVAQETVFSMALALAFSFPDIASSAHVNVVNGLTVATVNLIMQIGTAVNEGLALNCPTDCPFNRLILLYFGAISFSSPQRIEGIFIGFDTVGRRP